MIVYANIYYFINVECSFFLIKFFIFFSIRIITQIRDVNDSIVLYIYYADIQYLTRRICFIVIAFF